MSDAMDSVLSAHLDAWAESSRREPRRHARERALDAMLAAVISTPAAPRSRAPLFRPRFRHAGLLAASATLAAAVGVGAAGWNAPPGSALFAVRAARQGVMLKLPGSNDASLHLEFAEQYLAEARDHIDPEQSVGDAANELAAALPELPSDRTSPLWARYENDERVLGVETRDLEREQETPEPGISSPEPTDDPATGEPATSQGADDDTPRPSAGRSSSPSGWGWGDDDQSPSPGGGTPSPDD